MSQPEILTFGCRLNTYESEVIRNHTEAAGIDDVIVVNTCAVTAEAERQARQAIRRARRNKPDAKIVVTGCSAQISPSQYDQMDEVDVVLGNEEKLQLESWQALEIGKSSIRVNDIMSVTETANHFIGGFDDRARAFVQIQQGCDHRCTFCIIPYGRGPSRSTPVGEVIRQVRSLVENGYKEIVLTGVDLTDYGKDLPGQPTLGNLSRRLLMQVPALPRLRLSSLDPVEIDDDLFGLIEKERRLLPYFHLSLQAGDDMILKRMKRRHNRSDAIDICSRIRQLRPDSTFGADLIAGFPTETDEMFENTLAIVDECDLTHLHVFPYSERSGTPAAKMPSVPKTIRRERASQLRAAGQKRLAALMKSKIGKTAQVLVEKENAGRCEQFLTVRLDHEAEPGTILPCHIIGSDGNQLDAQAA
ncbi:MAG: tRNA (N(6)-L-threonylcarbamoyladenosine(37)-C(2))-methylthiotransferase MtaB [Rhodospirillaceae bacterium]|nr:tRNA (N(6)-L-threonylcarbamoyladenosine(37)-C(2))-methylthiotransferase MtaB [Rhodospirillaceae bacterium]|tara:strand:+ start:18158 stop:19408 length:1251 start_codon:yes stop_codon:yes gene_type:complete